MLTRIKPVHPKGSQPWIFTGSTDAEAPILWPPDAKSQLIPKVGTHSHFEPTHSLMLGKIEGKRRRDWQRIRQLDSITDAVDMNLSKLRGIEKVRRAWHAAVHGIAKSRTRLCNWKTPLPQGMGLWRLMTLQPCAKSHLGAMKILSVAGYTGYMSVCVSIYLTNYI